MSDPPHDARRIRRAPVIRAYDVGDTTVIVGPDGTAHELSGDSARLARHLLAFTTSARTRAEILAWLETLTGAPVENTGVVDELLALLTAAGAVGHERAPRHEAGARPRRRLVLALTGAVATAMSPDLVLRLQARGYEVRVVATESALRFVQALALEALVHHRVASSLWSEPGGPVVPHIALAQWADAVLVCPASATTISRLAAGDHSTLVGAIALATTAPVVVVPSMNVEMAAEPAVLRNVAQLVADGLHVVHAGTGVEVAHAPERRTAMPGPMPPHDVVVELLETVLRIGRGRRAPAPVAPRDAEEWDTLYRTRAAEDLPWHTAALDEDLASALAREITSGSRVLDLGTGLGSAAIEAARRGCRVVATDVSTAALERARFLALERASDAAIVWVRDDIADTRLHGEFDVILDRGCLHLLAPEHTRDYAAAVTRLTAPGGALLLKTHATSEGPARGTTPYDAASVERLLGTGFVLESDQPSTLAGPREAPAARLFVLRRRD